MTILITGGAGFIGANFVLDWVAGSDELVVNLDKFTYAGYPDTHNEPFDNFIVKSMARQAGDCS